MNTKTLYFIAPRQLEVRVQEVPMPGPNELLVESICCGISAGTEMLLYRGHLTQSSDVGADPISSRLAYPTPYGYCTVGKVIGLGPGVEAAWLGKSIFAFQPHSSHFVANAEDVLVVPSDLTAEQGIFLPNVETAVNLVQDAAPLLGERALVLGQGIVGLLVASLLRMFPLQRLTTVDAMESRRIVSKGIGVEAVLDSGAADFRERAGLLVDSPPIGYDFAIEVSGNPTALDDSIALLGYSGRIVIGSWYGDKKAALDLGGRFHRSRIRLIASQVSTIGPLLSGRWDKTRRFDIAWDAIRRIQPQRWISHRFALGEAAKAYALLDVHPDEALQVVFTFN